jgi:tRNA-dihydrouridine synthase A
MREAVKIPVTVKHRLGLNRIEDFAFVEKFVSLVSEAGCRTFIAHARNAVLRGLSPKENREVPPLKYDWVYRLKQAFPALEFVLNGGIARNIPDPNVDGIMLGRAAYHDPWVLADEGKTRRDVVLAMHAYLKKVLSKDVKVRNVTRHMLGLYHGHRRARLWRRMLSDSARLSQNDPALLLEAMEAVESGKFPDPETAHERRPQAQQIQVS